MKVIGLAERKFEELYRWLLDGKIRVGKSEIAKVVEEFRRRNAREIDSDHVDIDVVNEGHEIQEALVALIADGLCDSPEECARLVAEGTSFNTIAQLLKRHER